MSPLSEPLDTFPLMTTEPEGETLSPDTASDPDQEDPSPASRQGRHRSRARSAEDQKRVRRRFIDCARSLFAAEGAAGLTMRRLAAEAGYSPGTIYLYFPSRSDLLRVLWSEDIYSLLDSVKEATASLSDPVQVLRRALETTSTFWLARPDNFRCLFMENEASYRSERASFSADTSVEESYAYMQDIARQAIESRGLSLDLVLTVQSLFAAVHGVISLHVGNQGFPWHPPQQMIATILDSMFSGLGLSDS